MLYKNHWIVRKNEINKKPKQKEKNEKLLKDKWHMYLFIPSLQNLWPLELEKF